jgi:hypothetical protein
VRIRLRFFTTNLRQISQFLFRSQSTAIKPQEYAGELPKCRKLSIVDVCSLVLLESVHKEPAITKIGCDDDSRASALATTRRGNTLLEHMGIACPVACSRARNTLTAITNGLTKMASTSGAAK